MAIIRNQALYKQVADEIRTAIHAGTYPPGQPLPSETDLMATYGVSRPTVRQAIAVLRTEGLLDVIHGKGSYVRPTQATSGTTATLNRDITRTGKRYQIHTDNWTEAEQPTVYRTRTDRTTGPLLGLAVEELLLACDRLLIHQPTGTRAMHRTLLPMAVIEGTPLVAAPDTPPEQAYGILATGGHALTWQEAVRVRLPQPDERAVLGLPEATPVLIVYRITCDAADHCRRLMLEETRMGGDRGELTYTIETSDRHY